MQPFDTWQKDPKFNQLPDDEKAGIYLNYFDDQLADSEFRSLENSEQVQIKNNYLKEFGLEYEHRVPATVTRETSYQPDLTPTDYPGGLPEEKKFNESAFQKWYKGWAEKTNINPNPDDPRHYYDYRAAYQADAEPQISPEDGRYHWPSQFKSPDHPNRFVNGIDTITGERVRPMTDQERLDIALNALESTLRGIAVAKETEPERKARAEKEKTEPLFDEFAPEVAEPSILGKAISVPFIPGHEIARAPGAFTETEPFEIERREASISDLGGMVGRKIIEALHEAPGPKKIKYKTGELKPGDMGESLGRMVAEMGVEIPTANILIRTFAGTIGATAKAIRESNAWRKMTIPERNLVIQSLDDVIRNNPDMTEGQILRRYKNLQEEALAKRATTEGPIAEEITPEVKVPEKPAPSEAEKPPISKKGVPTYDFSSVQHDIEESTAKELKNFGERFVPKEDLYTNPEQNIEGLEKRPHITVKYGLHTADPKEVEPLLKDVEPIKAKLGKINVFEQDDHDVLVVDIESPELHELNSKISKSLEVTDTYPEYKPHVTIGYVNKGASKQFVGDPRFEGKEITIDKLTFSGKDGKTTSFKLEAEKPKEPKIKSKEKSTEVKKEPIKAPSKNPSGDVADAVASNLEFNRKIDAKKLQEFADEAFGGTMAQGAYSVKDMYDAMELGVNKWLLEKFTTLPIKPEEAVKSIKFLKEYINNHLPTQTKRTEETDEFQQFSTPPPLGLAANWVANISPNDVYMEPSAGVGGLAVFGKIAGARVAVNELSQARQNLLVQLPFDTFTKEDASQLSNLPIIKDIKPTVIVMNPPFSATAGRVQGKRQTMEGAKHIEQALKKLLPNGRLVAIVGKGMARNKPTFRDWWKKIESEYTVRANIGISGQEYKKYGTTFDNQILVIDKTGPTISKIYPTGKVDKIEDLVEPLKGVRNERIPQGERIATKPSGEEGAEEPTGRPPVLPPGGRPSGEPGIGGVRPVGEVPTIGEPERPVSGVEPGERHEVPGRAGRPRPVERPSGEKEPKERGGGGAEPTGQPPVSGTDRISEAERASGELQIKAIEKEKAGEFTEALYDNYKPERLEIKGASSHPTPLVQSAAMSAVDPPEPTYKASIPQSVINSGKLSDIQIESIIYAGQAHEHILPNGHRKGYFIGDGTGVGKGREIAGVLMDNWNKGRTKGVWISEKSSLFKDAKRDIAGAGWKKEYIHPWFKVKANQNIKLKKGILFGTYDTLKSAPKKEGAKKRIDQLVEWLGDYFDGVIAFDESHNMGNAIAMKGARGTVQPSQKALAGVELQKRLPKARILYVSATGATEVKNLSYATRLGLWGEGTPFVNVRNFINDIAGGGIASMEMVAQNMKATGAYTARSLSYDGVEYDRIIHKLTDNQRNQYNKAAEAWRIVYENMNKALEITQGDKTRAKVNAMSLFWEANQRFFSQVITSMQLPSVLNKMHNDLTNGHSVVIQLVSTLDAAQERALAKLSEEDSLDDLDLSPFDNLMQMVERSFPVQQYEEYTDEEGNIRYRPVLDSEGNHVLNSEAVEMREQLLDELGALRGDFADGPIDQIIAEFGVDNVAEVTGRKRRVVEKITKKGTEKVIEKRSLSKANADADAFMNLKKRILIFSEMGGTGRSYHPDLDAKNQQKRIHYLLQPGWRADKALQGLGRTHRSNQAHTPTYYLVTTDLRGQARFVSSIARRLDQLGALTRGSRETGSQGIFQAKDNLETMYAEDALQVLLNDIFRGNVPNFSVADFEKQTAIKLVDAEGRLLAAQVTMKKFLNRILAMEIDKQNELFSEFSMRLDNVIDAHVEAGTLDIGLETLKAKKIKKVSEEVVYTDPTSGANTRYVQLEVTNMAPILKWEEAKRYASEDGFYQNIKSQNVWATRKRMVLNRKTGDINEKYTLQSPTFTTQYLTPDEIENEERWIKVTDKEAETIWNKTVDELPKTITDMRHLVTGVLLPVWDRIIGHPRIMRVRTDEGEAMIGRLIAPKDLRITLKRLGATAGKIKTTPKEIHTQILSNNYRYILANGWELERRKVSGDYRIEIDGPEYSDFQILKNYGVFSERIAYYTRYFIPSDSSGYETIEKIIANSPVTDEIPPHGQYETKEKTVQYDIGEPSTKPEGERVTDRRGRIFKGQKSKMTQEQIRRREKAKAVKKQQIAIKNAEDAARAVHRFIIDRREALNLSAYETNLFVNDIEKVTNKAQREVIPFIIEETPIPKKLNRPDLEKIYKNDFSKLRDIADQVQRHFDIGFKKMKAHIPEMSAKQIENYVTHIWDLTPDQKRTVTNWFITQNRFLKKRYIATLKEGIDVLGLKPRTLDIADIIRIHDSVASRAIQNRKFVNNLKALSKDGVPLIARADKAPHDWVLFDHPALKQGLVIPGELKLGEKVSPKLRMLLDEMGVAIGRRISPVAFGKPVKKLGEYRADEPPEVRFQRFMSTKTIAHEIGHHIDVSLNLGQKFLDDFKSELYAINRERIESKKGDISTYGEAYVSKTEEQIAEFFATLFTDPDKAYKLAPNATVYALEQMKKDGSISKLIDFDFEKSAKVLVEEQLNTLVKLPIRVHPDLEKPLKVIFEERDPSKVARAWETINGYLKKTILSISLFHHLALGETGVATMGILKTGNIYFNPVKIYNGLIRKDYEIFKKEAIARDAVSHGLQLGATHDIPVHRIQQKLDDIARKTKSIPLANRITSFISSFNQAWDRALWDYLHDTLKLYAYEHLVSKLDPSKNLKLQKEETAQFVNDTFGGQNWDILMVSPRSLQWMTWLLLSPDWCVDDKTRAMTKTGWKNYNQLKIGDEILTIDSKTNKYKWSKIKDKYVNKNYDGDMIKISNHNRSIMMTPDHKCYTYHYSKKKYEIVYAKDLNSKHLIPRCAEFDLPKKEIYTDHFIKTIGWLITDGYFYKNKWKTKNGIKKHCYSGRIIQSKPLTVEIIKKLGYPFYIDEYNSDHDKFVSNYKKYVFSVAPKIINKIRKVGVDFKLSWEFLSKLSKRQLKLLYDTMMLGDGTGQNRFCGKEKEVFFMTMIQTMLGEASTFYQQEKNCWRTRIIKRSKNISVWGHNNNKSVEKYKGTIWCPSVDTGFWLAEREGLIFITGNTYSTLRQALSPTGIGSIHKETKAKRRKYGIFFWMKAAFYFGAGLNLINVALRKWDEEKNPQYYEGRKMTFWDRTMFGNPLGKRTYLFVGRYKDGTERYVRWGKQFRELFELFYDDSGFSPFTAAKKKIGGKLAPVLQFLSQLFTGATLSGYKNDSIDGKKGWEQALGIAKTLLKAPVPFALKSLFQEGKEFKITDIAMPSSKGMTRYKAIELYKYAIAKKDERMLKEIYQYTLQNNLPAYTLFNAALTVLKAESTKELKKGLKTEEDVDQQLKQTKNPADIMRLMNQKRRMRKENKDRKIGINLLDKAINEMRKYHIKENPEEELKKAS